MIKMETHLENRFRGTLGPFDCGDVTVLSTEVRRCRFLQNINI